MGGIIVVLIIIFYFYNRSQKKKVNAVYNDIENKRQTLESEQKEWEDRLTRLKDEIQRNKENLEEVKAEIVDSQKELFIKEVELSQIEYETSEEIKNQLSLLSLEEKELIKGEAIENTNFSNKKSYINNQIKQILRCFNAETDLILNNLTFKNVDSSRNKIIRSYEMLNKIFSVDNVSINEKFLDIKLRKLMLLFSHAQKLEDEKEQQKAIREQLVEEEKVRREIEQSKRKIEKEEQQFNNEISKLMSYLKKTDNDLEKELYISKIKDLEEKIKDLEKVKEDVLNREQNTRAGYVYIISNIGSFGENIYKIGMTRRLEPMDRIKELSSASVPFEFDVHAMIFSDDAPSLENILHKHFEKNAVNKVNLRKEFFNISLGEIEKVVKTNHNATVQFVEIPKAEQYRQSLEIANRII